MLCRAVGSCVTLLLALAQPAASQAPRFGVDQRVELMAILFKFAGNGEFNQNNFQPYIADIERHFGSFRTHEAVTIARGLREQYGLGFARVMAVAIRVSDPPALRERVPFDSVSGWTVPGDAARRFIEAARRFAVDSRATAFFEAHRPMYDSADARLRRSVERDADFRWFGDFYGVPSDRQFVVVPLLANSETSFGPCVRLPDQMECYSILGHTKTDSAGFPIYNTGFEGVVHEFAHGFANPLGNARRAEFERSGPRIHEQVAAAMRAQAYGWMSMINESLVRATQARYVAATKGEEGLREFLAEERQRSWFWLDELASLFALYEADRRTYPTLDAFMPRVVAYFDSLPGRVPAMQRRYDELRPKVLSVSIENGSDAVDPAIKEIVVQLDRPVREDGWCVVPVFGESGPSAESQQRVPKLTWKSLGEERVPFERGKKMDATGSTFRFGVELEPGKEYEFQLNTPHGFGLRSANGAVPLAPYRVRFKTRG